MHPVTCLSSMVPLHPVFPFHLVVALAVLENGPSSDRVLRLPGQDAAFAEKRALSGDFFSFLEVPPCKSQDL